MELDLQKIKKVFFVGIGGIGISAIARMMITEGKEVLGSDMAEGDVIHELRKVGAHIQIGQNISLIPHDVDLIVYTIALEVYDKPLLDTIYTLDIPVRSYPQMLEMVTKGKYTVAVSGTHGKTTTTAMIGHVLKSLSKDPSMIVGSLMIGDRSNFMAGKSEYFIVEACEYKRSFLHVHPTILVITNIDEDHLDYYRDLEDIKSAFRELVSHVPETGYVIADVRDPHIRDVLSDCRAHVIDYSKNFYKRALMIPGEHNQLDAAAAASVAHVLGLSDTDIDTALGTFPGTWRRFELKGTTKEGTFVYDDYAHHPREIEATLRAFRERYQENSFRLVVIFQPHLFSRTKTLFDDFAKVFSLADEVFLLPIYPAREIDDGSISSSMLADALQKNGVDAHAVTFSEAREALRKMNLSPKVILVTMGAGEAYKTTEALL